MEDNKVHLQKLIDLITYWLHIEDTDTIKILAAVKASHQINGDPIWLMLIGPSSDGKSEILKAFTAPDKEELYIDDLTEHSFISGFVKWIKDPDTGEKKRIEPNHFAKQIQGKIWFIYDFSILLTKKAETRSTILSQMRMIYDGRITKKYGNDLMADVITYPNTLIVGSTPAIDSTILEDQLLGTRFMTYRMNNSQTKTQRTSIMAAIDRNEQDLYAMRDSLKNACQQFFQNIEIQEYIMTDQENNNLAMLADQTTILRTSVQLDRNKEPMNLADPEGPGRLYKQLKKLYKGLRMIGCDEVETIRMVRKLCLHNITPVRAKILRHLHRTWEKHEIQGYTTSEIATACRMGKGSTKGNLHSLCSLGLVEYSEEYDDQQRRMLDRWRCYGFDSFNLLLGGQEKL